MAEEEGDNSVCPCCGEPVATAAEAARLRRVLDTAFETLIRGGTWCRKCGAPVEEDRKLWKRPLCAACQPIEAAVHEDIDRTPNVVHDSIAVAPGFDTFTSLMTHAPDGKPWTREALDNLIARTSEATFREHLAISSDIKAHLRAQARERQTAVDLRLLGLTDGPKSGGVLDHDHFTQPLPKPVDRHAFPGGDDATDIDWDTVDMVPWDAPDGGLAEGFRWGAQDEDGYVTLFWRGTPCHDGTVLAEDAAGRLKVLQAHGALRRG